MARTEERVTVGESVQLQRIGAAERALQECRTVPEALEGIAIAEAARSYASQVKAGVRIENFATSVKVKLEIRLASIVDEGQARGEIMTAGNPNLRGAKNYKGVTLAELGVDAPRLLEARQIAAVYTFQDIDAIVDEANAEDRSVSRRSLVIAANRARQGIEAEPKADPTAADRQRKHRLLERMRPESPLPRYAEPLEKAQLLLDVLAGLVEHLPDAAMPAVTELREGIKQIAWWPRP